MWLRLTGMDGHPCLINIEGFYSAIRDNVSGKTKFLPKKRDELIVWCRESIEEIEIMLAGKGAEVRKNDKGRDFIGFNPDKLKEL